MRTLMIPLLMATLPAMAVKPTNSLFVVVHSIDRVVADYYCEGQFAEVNPDAILIRSTVLSQGALTWHATGGTPPYRMIRDFAGSGGECITVMDADGNTASGCGSINEVHSKRFVDCSALPDSGNSSMHYIPRKKLETPSVPITVGPPVTGPTPAPGPGPTIVNPRDPGNQPPPPPSPGPGPDPKKPDHVTTGSNPTPSPAPPVGPNNTPNRPPVRRIAPAPGPTSHGTTTIHRVSNPTGGGGSSYHGTSNSSGSSSGGGTIRRSPVPH